MITFMLISLCVISDVEYISSTENEIQSDFEYEVSGYVGDTVVMPCEMYHSNETAHLGMNPQWLDMLRCGIVDTIAWYKNASDEINEFQILDDYGETDDFWTTLFDSTNPHRTYSLKQGYGYYNLELHGLTVEDEGTYICNVTYVNKDCNSFYITKLYTIYFIDLEPPRQSPVFVDYSKRWHNNTIPYLIDPSFSDSEREDIQSAAHEISSLSFVKFIELERPANYDFLLFQKSSECKTEEGRKRSPQILYLSSACFFERGIILHLLLHTLGIRHEHQRMDRDEYITVNWDNIMDEHQHLFYKYGPTDGNSLGFEYNYKSVMHFPSSLYAKNKSIPVLTPKDSSVDEFELGEGFTEGYLTQLDIASINKVYGCYRHGCERP